ncbi:MAG TPA: hypothetical protein VLD67_00715 [Vicinamibacterales bacterium]|nr:hypothetical protein [Vicinamibacterales bacterium]
MMGSTARRLSALAALMALPAAVLAQVPSPMAPPASQPARPVDQQAARGHLTDARNTLSDMTQIPAAAQLTGDARALVSELIISFNQMIAKNADWRLFYPKIEAGLNALLTSRTADEPAERRPGAVGTSGTAVSLDAEIQARLLEFRDHLQKFRNAAGGATPLPTGERPQRGIDREEAMRHLQAIEAIVGEPSAAGTVPSSLTLDRAQLEELRGHLIELRRLLGSGQGKGDAAGGSPQKRRAASGSGV